MHGARSTEAGVRAEYEFLEARYPKWQLLMQVLVHEADRHFDRIEFEAIEGRNVEVYFDITDWFGK
jgi:hypothetical protein